MNVWLHRLAGFRCEVHWVGYGMALDALRNQNSAWGANRAGLNVLLLRWPDIDRCLGAHERGVFDSELVKALQISTSARPGSTLVLMPPSTEESADTADDARTAALRSADGVHPLLIFLKRCTPASVRWPLKAARSHARPACVPNRTSWIAKLRQNTSL